MAAEGSRRFSEKETALILRRATEDEPTERGNVEGGLTLEELVAAAREAGIDPAAVRRAAAITAPPPDPIQAVLVGAPVHPIVRGNFPGRLPQEKWEAARVSIEDILGRHGEIEPERGGFLWQEDHAFGRSYVRARPDGDVVVVSAEAERKGHLLALMLGLATAIAIALQPMGGFAGLATVVGPLLSVLLPVAAMVAGTRLIWPALTRPVTARLERVALAVGTLVEEPSAPTGRALEPGSGRVD